jgi:signal transduction histidine kinase
VKFVGTVPVAGRPVIGTGTGFLLRGGTDAKNVDSNHTADVHARKLLAFGMASAGVTTMAIATWLDLSGGGAHDMTAAEAAATGAAIVVTAVLGVRIVWRQPRQPIGWILAAMAGVGGIVTLAEVYAYVGMARADARPGTELAAALSSASWVLAFGFLTALVVLFPNGRLPSREWRPLGWLSVVAFAGAWAGATFEPGMLDAPFRQVRNPVGISWLGGLGGQIAIGVFMIGTLVCITAAAAAVAVRFSTSRGVERLQMKWLAFATVLLPVALAGCYVGRLLTGSDFAAQVLLATALVCIPLAVGLAVLRYRLYDIDRLVNRTIVYGVVSVLLGSAFAGISALVGVAVGRGSAWATAAATVTTVLAFRALRDAVQSTVDRRFARAKYDARQVVARFLDDLRGDRATVDRFPQVLAEALGDTTAELRLWLPSRGTYVDIDGLSLGRVDPLDSRVATRYDHAGSHLAVVLHSATIKQQPELLNAVLSDAYLAMELARSRAEAAAHLAYVAESRIRIVEAGYEERRRLERDLHDGAQQRLVALGVALRRLQRSLPVAALILEPALEKSVGEISLAIADLRRLAAGVGPARLDNGLATALQDLAHGMPVPVDVIADRHRLSSTVEAAAYFVACEALTNAVKHADASQITVTARVDEGSLLVSVADDGVGGAMVTAGSGLAGLVDRVEAHGGRFTLQSPAGSGTVIEVMLPCGS